MSWKKPKIFCLNCGLRLISVKRRRVVEENSDVVEIIASWVSPLVITENDFICVECSIKAREAVTESLKIKIIKSLMPETAKDDDMDPKKVLGHRSVCITCGKSLLRCKSKPVIYPNRTELQLYRLNIIYEQVPHKNITTDDKICYACDQRFNRAANKTKTDAESAIEIKYNIKEEPNNEIQKTLIDVVKKKTRLFRSIIRII